MVVVVGVVVVGVVLVVVVGSVVVVLACFLVLDAPLSNPPLSSSLSIILRSS